LCDPRIDGQQECAIALRMEDYELLPSITVAILTCRTDGILTDFSATPSGGACRNYLSGGLTRKRARIAVNPGNPSQIVAVYQPATVAYSGDGAQTFTLADLPPLAGWGNGGDVSTTFDNKGKVYLSSLHFDKLGSDSYWAHGTGHNGIFVRRSLDGGKTWEKDATAVKTFEGNGPDSHLEDMPRIFADNVPTSPFAGNLYLGWIEWQLDKSIILFARFSDEGKTFSTPMRINTHAGLPRDDNGGLVGLAGVVGADGTISAIWNDGANITFTSSKDRGKTFAPWRAIMDVGAPYLGGAAGIPGVARVMGFPQIGVDPWEGKKEATCMSPRATSEIATWMYSLRPRPTTAAPGRSPCGSIAIPFMTATTSSSSG